MRYAFLASIAVAALASGCGDRDEVRGRAADSQEINVTVYFLTDSGTAPLGVRRSVPRSSPFARAALSALLQGPTEKERRAGISSAIPKQAAVRSFSIAPSLSSASGTATIDLGGLPSVDEAGAVDIARVTTQVARTLIGVSGIERVRLRANGMAWGFWSMQPPHRVLDRTWDYEALLGLSGICAAEPGSETRPRDCFSALP